MFPTIALAIILGQNPKPPEVTVVPKVDPSKPQQIAVDFGRSVTLTVPESVRWDSCDIAGVVELFPSQDGKSCVVVVSKPGKYVILATATTGPAAKIELTVASKPNNNDDDNVKPPPADPMLAKIKAAWDADPLQLDLRRKGAESLVAVYTQAAKVIEDPAIASIGQHSTQVKAVADQLFKDDGIALDSLAGVRKVLADELKAAFPAGPPTSLTADVRKLIDSIYARAARAIKTVSGI